MGGHKYTFMSEDGSNLSKIDQALVCDSFMEKWPDARFVALGRYLSYHSPLLLSCAKTDFGPIPFRFYNSWLEDDGLDNVVKKVMEKHSNGKYSMKDLASILKNLKLDIKEWRRVKKVSEEKEVQEVTKEVEVLEKMVESRGLTTTEKEKGP
ncbi:hypothetical protein HanRHA438_Chr08g0345281 [Helianthus annuus]|nr:hypothetical protein HanRHA438_Chr08g0345281 [Helianthus annuus]